MASIAATSKSEDIQPLPHLEATGASGPSANVGALVAAAQVVAQKHLEDERSEQENALSNLLNTKDTNPYYSLPYERNANSNVNRIITKLGVVTRPPPSQLTRAGSLMVGRTRFSSSCTKLKGNLPAAFFLRSTAHG